MLKTEFQFVFKSCQYKCMTEKIILHEVVIKQFLKAKKNVRSKDYCKADHNNVYCFCKAFSLFLEGLKTIPLLNLP